MEDARDPRHVLHLSRSGANGDSNPVVVLSLTWNWLFTLEKGVPTSELLSAKEFGHTLPLRPRLGGGRFSLSQTHPHPNDSHRNRLTHQPIIPSARNAQKIHQLAAHKLTSLQLTTHRRNTCYPAIELSCWPCRSHFGSRLKSSSPQSLSSAHQRRGNFCISRPWNGLSDADRRN